MSATSRPMLSTTLATFRGLQENLRDIISTLPTNTPTPLRDSLVNSHLKLSEYYTKIDESLYYTWASRECYNKSRFLPITNSPEVLDP